MQRNQQKTVLTLTILLACLPIPAFGQSGACTEVVSQTEMNQCARAKADGTEKELGAVYQALLKKVGPERQVKLKAAQDVWLAYRKRQCAFDTYGTRNGSVHPMVASECYEYYAIQHIKDLRNQLDCEEGNLSCAGE